MPDLDWTSNHDTLLAVAGHAVITDRLGTAQDVLDFFEKPHHYELLHQIWLIAGVVEDHGMTVGFGDASDPLDTVTLPDSDGDIWDGEDYLNGELCDDCSTPAGCRYDGHLFCADHLEQHLDHPPTTTGETA